MEILQNIWKQKAVRLVITAVLVYLAFRYLLPFAWPFLFAWLIAGLLRGVCRFLVDRVHLPGGFVCLAVPGVWYALLTFLLVKLFQGLFGQLRMLAVHFPEYVERLEHILARFCEKWDRALSLREGAAMEAVNSFFARLQQWPQSGLMELSAKTISVVRVCAGLLTFLLVLFIATVLILRDMVGDNQKSRRGGKEDWILQWLGMARQKLSHIGLAYLKTQGILLFIIAGICTIGLFLAGNRYALLIGLLIGLMDAFPVLGSGLVLVPWGVILLLGRHFRGGIILLFTYLVCQVTREILEPKLLGSQIGIRPIYTLIAMYTGLQLFGVVGFLLGPLGLVVIQGVMETEELTEQ